MLRSVAESVPTCGSDGVWWEFSMRSARERVGVRWVAGGKERILEDEEGEEERREREGRREDGLSSRGSNRKSSLKIVVLEM